MGITLREASEKVGVTRQTLMKAIKTGRVSGQKSDNGERSEEHTSELQSLMRISYAVFCLKKKIKTQAITIKNNKINQQDIDQVNTIQTSHTHKILTQHQTTTIMYHNTQ